MAAWTGLDINNLLPGEPMTSAKALAFFENPIAMAAGEASAPVIETGWHPYNLSNVGDSEDGTIYDFAVDGAASAVALPAFEDGYEYGLIFDGVSRAVGGQATNLFLRATLSNAATHDFAISDGMDDARTYSGIVALPLCRVTKRDHRIEFASPIISSVGAAASATPTPYVAAAAVKVASAEVRLSVNSFDAGVIRMIRRRDYISG